MAASPYQDAAITAANKYGVPVNMFLWQIGKESSWNPNATNPNSSAKGIAQFVDGTAQQFGINPLDPYQSLDAAAKYDAQLFKSKGSWQGALESYGTLHDADAKTMQGFSDAIGQDAQAAQTGSNGGMMDTLKSIWDNSMGGLATSVYKNATGQDTGGNWDFTKWLGSGTFIVLGIVVIALAILSNKSVQTAAVTAVTKGK